MKVESLIRRWLRKSREFESAVEPHWKNGDKFASRRYEGQAIAYRWCAEDLKLALKGKR